MIEKTLLDYLIEKLHIPVFCEVPENVPDTYIILERTGGSVNNHLKESTFAFKSYAPTLLDAATLDASTISKSFIKFSSMEYLNPLAVLPFIILTPYYACCCTYS